MTNPFAPTANFFKSVVEEGRKVVWPTRPTVLKHTLMVIISVAIAMLVFASIDFGLQKLVLYIVSN